MTASARLPIPVRPAGLSHCDDDNVLTARVRTCLNRNWDIACGILYEAEQLSDHRHFWSPGAEWAGRLRKAWDGWHHGLVSEVDALLKDPYAWDLNTNVKDWRSLSSFPPPMDPAPSAADDVPGWAAHVIRRDLEPGGYLRDYLTQAAKTLSHKARQMGRRDSQLAAEAGRLARQVLSNLGAMRTSVLVWMADPCPSDKPRIARAAEEPLRHVHRDGRDVWEIEGVTIASTSRWNPSHLNAVWLSAELESCNAVERRSLPSLRRYELAHRRCAAEWAHAAHYAEQCAERWAEWERGTDR